MGWRQKLFLRLVTLGALFLAGASIASGGHDSGPVDFRAANVTSRYRVSAPHEVGPRAKKCLIVYLNGDVGKDFEGKFSMVKREADRYRCVGLSVLSPPGAGCTSEGRCWWTSVERNARYLNSVLAEIDLKYGIDPKRVLFTGQSGGTTFLGGYYLPFHGKGFGGGALLACAGDVSAGASGIPNGPRPDEFKVRVATSERDFLRPGALDVYRAFSRSGYPTRWSSDRRGGHCSLGTPYAALLSEEAKQIFGRAKPSSPKGETPWNYTPYASPPDLARAEARHGKLVAEHGNDVLEDREERLSGPRSSDEPLQSEWIAHDRSRPPRGSKPGRQLGCVDCGDQRHRRL